MFLHVSVILFTVGGLWRTPPGPGRHPPGPGRTPPGPRRTPQDQGEPPWTRHTPPRTRQTPPPTRQTTPPRPGRPPREEDCSIRSMSGRYASYWNAFLLSNSLNIILITTGKAIMAKKTHIDCMLSVRFVSNVRNCFPFLVNPRTSAPAEQNIRSLTWPTGPPNSNRVYFIPGKVLNACFKYREKWIFITSV